MQTFRCSDSATAEYRESRAQVQRGTRRLKRSGGQIMELSKHIDLCVKGGMSTQIRVPMVCQVCAANNDMLTFFMVSLK